jgi:hypothetical protein
MSDENKPEDKPAVELLDAWVVQEWRQDKQTWRPVAFATVGFFLLSEIDAKNRFKDRVEQARIPVRTRIVKVQLPCEVVEDTVNMPPRPSKVVKTGVMPS